MDLLITIGYLAGTLTTLAFLPQVIKTLRSRSAHDISAGTLILLFSGVALWTVYGVIGHDLPVIYANGMTLCLVFVLVIMKFRFDH